MASPPKPWERSRTAAPEAAAAAAAAATIPTTASSTSPISAAMATTGATGTLSSSSTAPAVPPIPASLTASVNQNAANFSRLAATSPVTSPYGGYNSGYTPYRYGGYGGYGSGMGTMGGMGGYGSSMYGGYGSMYGSGGMYGASSMYGGAGGLGGMQRDPNDPNSLTNRFGTSTQATFQMLEGIVGAFGGFAQMLESTYMATHSSFFAMVSVAEQFSNLRDTLGSILGIFTLMRFIRTLIARLTGRPLPADATALTPAAFARFEGRAGGAAADAAGASGAPKPSRKPLFVFVLAAFGLPYLMGKLIKSLAASHEEEGRRQMALMQQQQQQQQQQLVSTQLDPSKLEFCRVLYDYAPQQQQQVAAAGTTPGMDLAVKRDDLVVVLSKADPLGSPSDWWQCRTRDGRVGYLPATFLRVIALPSQQQQLMPASASTSASTKTMPSMLPSSLLSQGVPAAPASVADSSEGGRANTIVSTTTADAAPISTNTNTATDPIKAEKAAAQKQSKAAAAAAAAATGGNATADNFTKSAFYN